MNRFDEGVKEGRPAVVAVAVRVFCLLCFSVASYAAFHMGDVPSNAQLVHYTVANDETVWTISERIAKADDVNPEAVEETVQRVNALIDGQVWPGEDILVPKGS